MFRCLDFLSRSDPCHTRPSLYRACTYTMCCGIYRMLLWSRGPLLGPSLLLSTEAEYGRSPSIVVDCVTFCEGVDELETETKTMVMVITQPRLLVQGSGALQVIAYIGLPEFVSRQQVKIRRTTVNSLVESPVRVEPKPKIRTPVWKDSKLLPSLLSYYSRHWESRISNPYRTIFCS